MYCVYITIYGGNKLPPFYIGSSSVDRLKNGYYGSVSSKLYKSIWEEEIQYNSSLFKTKIISLHKTRQEALEKECKLQKRLNVVKNPLYVNQSLAKQKGYFGKNNVGSLNPMYGKIVKNRSRKKITNVNRGRPLSEQHKIAISKSKLGKFCAKRSPLNEETKRKISKAKIGKFHTEETKLKMRGKRPNISGSLHPMYGKIPWNKGIRLLHPAIQASCHEQDDCWK